MKIFEIEQKWEEGVESGELDAGDLFAKLLDIAYGLESKLKQVNNVTLDDVICNCEYCGEKVEANMYSCSNCSESGMIKYCK